MSGNYPSSAWIADPNRERNPAWEAAIGLPPRPIEVKADFPRRYPRHSSVSLDASSLARIVEETSPVHHVRNPSFNANAPAFTPAGSRNISGSDMPLGVVQSPGHEQHRNQYMGSNRGSQPPVYGNNGFQQGFQTQGFQPGFQTQGFQPGFQTQGLQQGFQPQGSQQQGRGNDGLQQNSQDARPVTPKFLDPYGKPIFPLRFGRQHNPPNNAETMNTEPVMNNQPQNVQVNRNVGVIGGERAERRRSYDAERRL